MRDRNGKIILIDLDASVSFNQKQYAGAKYSSAYIPPEMILFDENLEKKFKIRSVGDNVEIDHLIVATPQFDMWSLGVVMYQLCTNEPLFLSDGNDNMDEVGLKLLADFPDLWKQSKMNKIIDMKARNLISRLLSKDPMKRPLTVAVLDHPFLSGKSTTSRMVGQEPAYDVFLSYRVWCDAIYVDRIYDLLIAKGLKVWWDKKCLAAGVPWEDGFCDGLVNSRSFVCIISEAAVSESFSSLTETSPCDNVLLEHQLAIELRGMGFIEYIYPIFIGNISNKEKEIFHKFQFKCIENFPKITVNSVIDKLTNHLNRQALGSPNNPTITVNEVMSLINANQGGFIQENGIQSFHNITESIYDMLLKPNETSIQQQTVIKTEDDFDYKTDWFRQKDKIRLLEETIENFQK